MSSSRSGSSHSSSWRIFSLARLGLWPFQVSSKILFQFENQKTVFFANPIFFPYFSCIFTLFSVFFVVNNIFSYFETIWEICNIKKKSLELKKAIYQKKSSSVSARKLKCSAWLDSARKHFSSARLSLGNFSSNSSLDYLCTCTYLLNLKSLTFKNSTQCNGVKYFLMEHFHA